MLSTDQYQKKLQSFKFTGICGGRTSWGKVVDYADVRDTCFRVAECLDLHGSINIQLIITRNGPMILK